MKKENKSWTIYTHTTPDGMVYVGITTNIKTRWRASAYHNPDFSKEIEMWGWNNIQHTELKTIDSEEKTTKRIYNKLSPLLRKVYTALENWYIEEEIIKDPIDAFLNLDNVLDRRYKLKKVESHKKRLQNVETGEIYDSVEDASTKLKKSRQTISKYIKNKKLVAWNEE